MALSNGKDSDTDLLERFVRSNDQDAFTEIVLRRFGLVVGAARRRLGGDPELAEEVAQNVFTTLARRAAELDTHPCLSAWLQKATAHESMRALKKKSVHAKKLNRFKAEMNVHKFEEVAQKDDHLEAALPFIDEAIASLGASDRQTLMLRFYEGLSFRAISHRLGKTEAATQKQSRRALAKVARTLRRRGIVVSLQVLATGLATELTANTASAAAHKVATVSLSNATAAGNSLGLLSTTLISMKFSTYLTASIFLITCMITGFVAGKLTTPVHAGDPLRELPSSLEPTVLQQKLRPTRSALPAPVDTRQALRNLLDFARAEFRGGDVRAELQSRAIARLAQIPPNQIRTALELISEMPGGFNAEHALTDALMAVWAKHNGEAACEFSLSHRKSGVPTATPLSKPLVSWAEHAPEAALRWYLMHHKNQHPALGEGKIGATENAYGVGWIMAAWARVDMDGAVLALQQLDSKLLRSSAVNGIAFYAGELKQRTKLLNAINQWPGNERASASGRLVSALSENRPENIAYWLDAQSDNVRHDRRMPRSILSNWLEIEGNAAAEWWLKRPRDRSLSEQIDELVHVWAHIDIDSAAEWMNEQILDANYDSAFLTFTQEFSRRDPQSAFHWGTALADGQRRKQATNEAVDHWKNLSPEEAREAVIAAKLPDELKQELEASLR